VKLKYAFFYFALLQLSTGRTKVNKI